MATFEQIQALLARQDEKNIERLDQLVKNIEKNVKESLTEEVVKKVVKSLGPTIMDKVEKEVSKAVEPVMKQQEKTEAELNKIKEVLEKLSDKVNSQEMVKNKIESEAPALQKEKAGAVWGGGQGGKGAESGARETPEIEKKEKGDIERMFSEANSTLTFSPMDEDEWKEIKAKGMEEGKMEECKAEEAAYDSLVADFLSQEMGMNGKELKEVMKDVKDIYPKTSRDWKVLVVNFRSEATAQWVLQGKAKMRQGVQGENKPALENWVPERNVQEVQCSEKPGLQTATREQG